MAVVVGAVATSLVICFVIITGTLPSPEMIVSTLLASGTVAALLGLYQGPPATIGEVLYQTEQSATNTQQSVESVR